MFPDRKNTIFPNLWYKSAPVLKQRRHSHKLFWSRNYYHERGRRRRPWNGLSARG